MNATDLQARLASRQVSVKPTTKWLSTVKFVEKSDRWAAVVKLEDGAFVSLYADEFTCAVGLHSSCADAVLKPVVEARRLFAQDNS